MDGIMNYPVYFAMMEAFQLPGPANMSALVETMKAVNKTMPVRISFYLNRAYV